MLTYAQNFEDVMLVRLFQGQATGFYIDVGAWHPVKHSVTKHFYDNGWSGINIEPLKRQFVLFIAERLRDINLNVALSDCSGSLPFYECEDDTALSTADSAQAERLRLDGQKVREYEVTVLTLDQVFERHVSRPVDFLKIDVEDWETHVLKGIDLERFRPRVLLIEATKPAIPVTDWDNIDVIANWHEWEPLVLQRGYVFAYYDGLSRFYVRHEDEILRHRLRLPPGVYDHIDYPEISRLKSLVAEIERDREARLRVIEQLQAELQASEADRAARLRVIEQLQAELQASEADRAARLRVIERLQTELVTVEEAGSALRKQLENCASTLERMSNSFSWRLTAPLRWRPKTP